jgi:hypothetical protein
MAPPGASAAAAAARNASRNAFRGATNDPLEPRHVIPDAGRER